MTELVVVVGGIIAFVAWCTYDVIDDIAWDRHHARSLRTPSTQSRPKRLPPLCDLLIAVTAYFGLGLIVSVIYRGLWGGPWRWRHFYAWPIIHGSLLIGWPPPAWMHPAPKDVAAVRQQQRARLRG